MRKISFVFPLILCLIWCGSVAVYGQVPKEAKTPVKPPAEKEENSDLLRWRVFVDGLFQEARSISPEERRPYAVAEVAAAYWEIDRDESKAQFISALEAAWKLSQQDKKYGDLIDDVMTKASRVDVSLAKALTKRPSELRGEEKYQYDIAGSNALELLKEDPQRAAELVEAFAPNGLPMAALNFIFALSKVNLPLANRVYRTYLEKAGADERIPIENVLPLAGYSFGYAEYYSPDRRGGIYTGQPATAVPMNPALAKSFLDLAYRRIAAAIEQRNNAIGADVEGRNFTIIFSLEYLIPEVSRFSPETIGAWDELRQAGMVGVAAEQAQKVMSRLGMIRQTRSRVQAYAETPETMDVETETSLKDVDKIVGTCERDMVYMKASLHFSYRKNFKRALELLSKVEGEKRADSVRKMVFFDIAMADIQNGDWDAAEARIKKIPEPTIKALAQVRLAEGLFKKNDKQQGGRAADEAVAMIEKYADPQYRPRLLFALASILLKPDPAEAKSTLDRAIKSLNKIEPDDTPGVYVRNMVLMSCIPDDKGGVWYDNSPMLDNATVFDAITLFAKENPDTTTTNAEGIADKITRNRSLAIVGKFALTAVKKKRTK